jgi:hypothetical protein
MAIKNSLMAGAALGVLCSSPAMAGSTPDFHVFALHQGRVVTKTLIRAPGRSHLTYTYTTNVSTSVSTAADYGKAIKLVGTFIFIASSDSICAEPPQKLKLVSKKTPYAKLGTTTETYSLGCANPTVIHGDTYDLQTRNAAGKTDSFVSILSAKYKKGGIKYREMVNEDVSVKISR